MIGREWYYYFLPGGIALLLVLWLLYSSGNLAIGASAATGATGVTGAIAAAPAKSAAVSGESVRAQARAADPGAAAAAVARAGRHFVVAPSDGSEVSDGTDEFAAAAQAMEGFSVVDDMTQGPGAPAGDFRPCDVYFTDNVKVCDTNEFRYNVAYYEQKMKEVRAAVKAKGGAPTKKQNDLILKYSRILSDYAKFPNAQFCKLSLPNWQQRTSDKQQPIISKSERNKDRGPTEHWAYCWRDSRTTNAVGLAKTGMVIDKIGGKPAGTNFGGAFYVRGKCDEKLTPEQAIKTYCHESDGRVPLYPMKAAIVMENVIKGPLKTRYYRNNKPAGVGRNEIDIHFRDQLFKESVVRSGSSENAVATPQPRSVRLVKTARDPCGRVIDHYSTIATARFTESIKLSSTQINGGDNYLRGTTYQVEATLRAREGVLAQYYRELQDINNLINYYVAMRNHYAYMEYEWWKIENVRYQYMRAKRC